MPIYSVQPSPVQSIIQTKSISSFDQSTRQSIQSINQSIRQSSPNVHAEGKRGKRGEEREAQARPNTAGGGGPSIHHPSIYRACVPCHGHA